MSPANTTRNKDQLRDCKFEVKDRAIRPVSSYYVSDLKKKRNYFTKPSNNHLKQLLDTSLNGGRVGTTDHLDLLAVLEEEEGGHSGNAVIGSDLAELVNINLVELDAGVLHGETLDLRGNGLAGTAPLGEEVDEDGLGGVDDLGLPFLLAVRIAMLEDGSRIESEE